MTAYKPLVLIAGKPTQLSSSDTLDAVVAEVDVVAKTNGNAGTITIGQAVYASSGTSVDLARANASGTVKVIGLVRSTSIAAAASGSIQTNGLITATTTQWDAVTGQTGGLTQGSEYFLSDSTAGRISTTPPTTGYSKLVGTALSTTELLINIGETYVL